MMKFQSTNTFVISASFTLTTFILNKHFFNCSTFNSYGFSMTTIFIFMRSTNITILSCPTILHYFKWLTTYFTIFYFTQVITSKVFDTATCSAGLSYSPKTIRFLITDKRLQLLTPYKFPPQRGTYKPTSKFECYPISYANANHI